MKVKIIVLVAFMMFLILKNPDDRVYAAEKTMDIVNISEESTKDLKEFLLNKSIINNLKDIMKSKRETEPKISRKPYRIGDEPKIIRGPYKIGTKNKIELL